MLARGDFLGGNRRGQATVFILIAVVIIAGIGIYLAVKPKAASTQVPSKFQPLEEYYQSCIKEIALEGINTLGGRGGWIEDPEFVRGNALEPLSSHLNFMGNGIPYWMYVKDGSIVQQVPTKNSMEEQLAGFIEARLYRCGFEGASNGFTVKKGEEVVEASINSDSIRINVQDGIVYSNAEESAQVMTHSVEVETSLGRMYDKALEIFNNEMQEEFLENYTIDVIRLYAPVDGVEISCAPKVWREGDVFNNIMNALEANIPQIRLSDGRDLSRASKNEKYFTQPDIKRDGFDVQFLYSKKWLTKIDLGDGSEGGIMIANPVGNQEGLGILGFCYVPYHFVYDFDYPVMVQIVDENGELFQYPVQVIIRGNQPRQAIEAVYEGIENEVCRYKNSEIEINTYDSESLESVEAQISFKCLNQGCYLGETRNGGATLLAPRCVNGFLTAEAGGYERAKYQISTNSENSSDILLDKLHNLSVEVEYDDGESITASAFIYFTPDVDKPAKTVAVGEKNSVMISEGGYNITAYVYQNDSISFPPSKEKKCFQVTKPGLAGFFGGTTEQCYDVTIPGQTIQYSLSGGGSQYYYFTQSQLKNAGKITIKIPRLPVARNIESLQKVYSLAEVKKLDINLE